MDNNSISGKILNLAQPLDLVVLLRKVHCSLGLKII